MSTQEEYQLFRIVTAAVIRNNDGKFLLAKRHSSDKNLPDFWSIPAGHVEVVKNDNDTLESNLTREVREELGIDIAVEDYLDSHSWVAEEYKKITIVFLCKIVNGEPRPLSETSEISWFNLQEVSKLNLPPNVLRVLTKASGKLLKIQ